MVNRGIAIHKMIRLITASTVNGGYLNFMGNEFGHPEWIDFPREGNGWSYKYARRQWSLADNPFLKYEWLRDFDKAMIGLVNEYHILKDPTPVSLWVDQERKIISFSRGGLLFLFDFHPGYSETGFFQHAHTTGEGKYQVIFSTDEGRFGGTGAVDHGYQYETQYVEGKGIGFEIYVPCRTAMVLKKTE